ncbi:MAG: GAF domain-containing protein [Dehalococcoidia bacterium]|nr:GAF domain-containing protein [Dehalococcoidia bacterium]
MEEIEKESILREEEEQLALVDSLSRATLSCSGVSEIRQRFTAELSDLMEIDWAAIAIIDKPKDAVYLSPLSHEISSTLDLGDKMLLSGTPIAWVAENKCAAVEPDLTQESRFWTGIFWLKQEIRSLVYLPLFWQREVYAVLVLGSKKPGIYQEHELKLLRYAASQLAIPLKSFQLMEERQRQEETLNILSKLSAIITSGTDLPQAFPQFAQELKRFIPFDRLALAQVEGNLRILAVFSAKETRPKAGEAYPLRDSAIPWLLKYKRINVETDFAQTGQFPVNQLHLNEGLRSEIRLPLFSRDRLFASLHLSRCEPYTPREEELTFLEQLAKHISSPIENHLHTIKRKESLDWFRAIFHYTKTPLTPIVSSSKLLTEELQNQSPSLLLQLAQNIREASQSLQGNVELFEKVAQLESSQAQLSLETFSVRDLLTEVASYALTKAARNSQLFILELSPDLPQISADSQKLEQALYILLDNAIKRSPQGSKIEFRARAIQNELIVEVIDWGPAFSLEEKKSLLEPYYPSQANHLLFPELSLSLAICRHIVELHDGEFWLESKPDGETTFSFSLPLISPEQS